MDISNEKDSANNNKTLVNNEEKSVSESEVKGDENETGVCIAVPPDGGWGWAVVAASFVANFIVDGILYCYGDFIPFLKNDFDEPMGKLSIPGSLLSGFYLMTGPFVSIVTNKFGFQKVVVIGSILAALFFAGSSLAMNVEFLIVSYGILGGIAFGMIYSPSIVIVGYYFEKWRGIAMGIAVCGSGIGTFAISPLNTFLLETVKWKNTFLIQAGIILICVLCGLVFRPVKPVKVVLNENTDDEDVKVEESLKRKKSITQDIEYLNNNKPPTAAEVLCINNRPYSGETTTSRLSKSSHCLDMNDLLHKSVEKANKTQKRLSVPNLEESCNTSPQMQTKLRSMSQGALKRKKSLINEKILLSHGQSIECMIKNRRGTITQVDKQAEVPLQRDDAFFAGSLNRLSQYKAEDSISYTLSVTRVPVEIKKKPFWRTILDLFDFSLLLSPSFDLLLLSGLLTMLGYFTPFTFVKDRAEVEGLNKNDISWLLSTIGITNTIGRVLSGMISGLPGMDATFINNIALTIAGIATMTSGLVMTLPYQYAYCAIFGLSTAAFASLRSIMVVDLLGLENLNNAFGILLFVQGFGSALGAPVAGAIKDSTGGYEIPFYFSGILIMLSGLVLIPLKAINRWEKRKKKENERKNFT